VLAVELRVIESSFSGSTFDLLQEIGKRGIETTACALLPLPKLMAA
jgi:hypothetical protein